MNNFIETYNHSVGVVCNEAETAKNLAKMLGTEIFSRGSRTNASLFVMESGLCIGIERIISSNSHRHFLKESLVVVSSTTKQWFDGIYTMEGVKVAEMPRYAFSGTAYLGDVPERFKKK